MEKNSEAEYKMGALRRHVASLVAEDAKTTEKLIKKLTDTDKEFISSFDAEAFMELQALRTMAHLLTRMLERFDAGESQFEQNGPLVTDPLEFIGHLIEEMKKKILSKAVRTSFSSSVASNQMANYEASMELKVVRLFEW